MTINLLVPVRLIQAALPYVKNGGRAAVVNMGSISDSAMCWAISVPRSPCA